MAVSGGTTISGPPPEGKTSAIGKIFKKDNPNFSMGVLYDLKAPLYLKRDRTRFFSAPSRGGRCIISGNFKINSTSLSLRPHKFSHIHGIQLAWLTPILYYCF